ncbi:MAG: DMT family transporter [Synergistaceae bacterium]|jgi:transporter family-2 protein|nr:DMT family transporter [Synergistaceae bacterium]
MSHSALLLLLLLGGAATALQPSVNGSLAQKVGVLESAFLSFAVGAAVLLPLALTRGQGSLTHLGKTSWWEWLGGPLGAVYVLALIVAVPRLGTTVGFSMIIAAQLATGLFLDATDFCGFGAHAVTLPRLVGVALVFFGAWLVRH